MAKKKDTYIGDTFTEEINISTSITKETHKHLRNTHRHTHTHGPIWMNCPSRQYRHTLMPKRKHTN